jgi:hypothetical protein
MCDRYRSLADLARNNPDRFAEDFGPEEENPAGCVPLNLPTAAEIDHMAAHFGQQPAPADPWDRLQSALARLVGRGEVYLAELAQATDGTAREYVARLIRDLADAWDANRQLVQARDRERGLSA